MEFEDSIFGDDVWQPSEQTCSTCMGDGILLSTEDRYISAKKCTRCSPTYETQRNRDRFLETLNYAQIPSGFLAAAKVDNLPNYLEEWYSKHESDVATTNRSIFLCGPSAAGKTFCAVALIFRLAKKGIFARYIDCAEYLMDRRSSYGARHLGNIGDTYTRKTENDRWSLSRCEIAILDNIGVGTANDWSREQYDLLIESRHSSGKTTIYISNFSDDPQFSIEGKKLSSIIGPRPAARINQAPVIYLKDRTSQTHVTPDAIFEPVKPPRPLAPNETTFLHIWAREGLFSMVSKKERSTLTAKSKVNRNEFIELPSPKPREYISWSGYHIILQGPVVDYEDANVLAALMKIYHKVGNSGSVQTSIGAILSELGLSTESGSNAKQLKRSLVRLAESRITMRTVPDNPKVKSDEMMWIGGFLDSVIYEGGTRNKKVIVKFNDAMAPFYQKKSLVLLPLDTLTSLSSYAQGIYRFLIGHRDTYKFIGLNRWREILAINPTVKEKNFKDCMRLAVKELIERKLISDESRIDRNGVFHSYLIRSVTEQFH